MHKTWMLPQPKHRPSSLHAHCIGVDLVLLGAEDAAETLLHAGDINAVSARTPGHVDVCSLSGEGLTWCCWVRRRWWNYCYVQETWMLSRSKHQAILKNPAHCLGQGGPGAAGRIGRAGNTVIRMTHKCCLGQVPGLFT